MRAHGLIGAVAIALLTARASAFSQAAKKKSAAKKPAAKTASKTPAKTAGKSPVKAAAKRSPKDTVFATAGTGPTLTITPRGAEPGTLLHVTLSKFDRTEDSTLSIAGTIAGEPLHFRDVGNGTMQALGAIPIDVSDSLVTRVVVAHASGVEDSARISIKYPHRAPSVPAATPAKSRVRVAGARRLKVDPKFTRASAEADARVERENELAREVGHKAQDTPQLWTLPFLKPRDSKITSKFGSGRVFNGRVSSSHLGVDFRGATGEPILAANRGVVALVAEFYLAGNVVYLDHGDGIVTGYFHMSKPEVAVGDTVERGQEIGLVGATGRVTGPHLHWSARFGAMTIDPGDLFGLGAPWVETIGLQTNGPGAGSVSKR